MFGRAVCGVVDSWLYQVLLVVWITAHRFMFSTKRKLAKVHRVSDFGSIGLRNENGLVRRHRICTEKGTGRVDVRCGLLIPLSTTDIVHSQAVGQRRNSVAH